MTVSVAVLGAGRWGRTLIRAFTSLSGAHVPLIVDPAEDARRRVEGLGFRTASDARVAFHDPTIEAVAIASPPSTHAPLALAALGAGKHVFVEKPLCLSLEDGERIRAAAQAARRSVMVGHLMLHHPAVDKLRELVGTGRLGALRYLTATRVNLGVVRTTENVWWSLAPHDVSMILALVGSLPTTVSVRGTAFLRPGVEDVVFAQLEFASGVRAAIHVSWLDPHKRRELTVVGDRRMATFDDMQPSEKIRVFDVGEPPGGFESFAEMVAMQPGDIAIPRLEAVEPLRRELDHFIESVSSGTPPSTGIDQGLDVVRVLEAGQRSLECAGADVPVRRGSLASVVSA